jgi:hypothetical protein
MAITGRTIVTDAAFERGLIAAGETLSPENADTLLGMLARLVDNWNAEREAIYSTDFLTFTFTPGLNPHTIGPTGTWVTASRPVTIEAASVVLSGASSANQINAPSIYLHDQSVGVPRWYQSLTMPNITTSYPTDGYYDATYPNGSLYLWPVPSTAYQCQLQVRGVLAAYTLSTTFAMPPGYRDAVTLTLAEAADGFGFPTPSTLPARAAVSRSRIFRNNTGGGALRTNDAGMSGSSGRRSNFNWLTGLLTTGRGR